MNAGFNDTCNVSPLSHSFVLFLECISGYYGENCNITCSHCNSSAPTCNRYNGYCLFGCQDGRNTSTCGDLFLFVTAGVLTFNLFCLGLFSIDIVTYFFLNFMLIGRLIWENIINKHNNDIECLFGI